MKKITVKELADIKASVLSDQDLVSATFEKLKSFYLERLEMLRRQNDSPKDETKTALLRGRIAEVKYFLALAISDGEENEPDDFDY
jgi:hypothetical protein